VEIGSVMFGKYDSSTGELISPPMEWFDLLFHGEFIHKVIWIMWSKWQKMYLRIVKFKKASELSKKHHHFGTLLQNLSF